ncbi:fungal-specific transcription factor domain-containing protein [Dactylonectria macrodidyma]|uniref:Fungal-specific transcription factor domain-containing protein n=1 Tax=Dactylonectria macrodidyma TaxID=307937 RepID=A0A9P9IKT1_9HYPO|nr:fungal-specific transcription factor domain-containing protein [Dactylonectria macrodidyma]
MSDSPRQPSLRGHASPSPLGRECSVSGAAKAQGTRARNACMRCYKQKLKCDNERPCALCTRSSMECMENVPRPRKGPATTTKHRVPTRREPRQPSPVIHDAMHTPSLSVSESGPPSPASEEQSTVRVSTHDSPTSYRLYFHIYDEWHSSPAIADNTEDNPRAASNPNSISRTQKRVPVVDLVDMQLPPADVAELLLDSYIKTSHWYQLIVHEALFREEFGEMIRLGTIEPRRFSFLILSFVILAMGCTFADQKAIQERHPGYDTLALQKKMIRKVEGSFLEMFDIPTLESVQVATLLTSYLGFHGNIPRRAYVVLGAAIKSALSLGLHNESSWGDMNPIQREVRRRCWQNICISETFIAINCGRPCLVNKLHWDVILTRNIDDTLVRCPGYTSTELLEDGSRQDVTILSYQRRKFNLYKIMFNMIEIFYLQKAASIKTIIQQAKSLRQRLETWESEIPPELRLSSYKPGSPNVDPDQVVKVFKVQALALQLLYYNAQIILYRPFLTYDSASHQRSINKLGTPIHSSRMPSVVEGTAMKEIDLEFYQTCRSQCWEAAIKTAKVCEYQDILKWAGRSPVAPFIGIHTFTAGAVLCLFALSCPLTATAQRSKQALGRLIQISRIMDSPATLANESAKIAKDFLKLVLSEEMQALTSGKLDDLADIGFNQKSDEILVRTSKSLDVLAAPQDEGTPRLLDAVRNATNDNRTPSSDISWQGGAGQMMHNKETPTPLQHHTALSSGTFDDAVVALQSVFRDGRAMSHPQDQSTHNTGQYHNEWQGPEATYGGSTYSSVSPGYANFGNVELSLNSSNQMWIWDNTYNF